MAKTIVVSNNKNTVKATVRMCEDELELSLDGETVFAIQPDGTYFVWPKDIKSVMDLEEVPRQGN